MGSKIKHFNYMFLIIQYWYYPNSKFTKFVQITKRILISSKNILKVSIHWSFAQSATEAASGKAASLSSATASALAKR